MTRQQSKLLNTQTHAYKHTIVQKGIHRDAEPLYTDIIRSLIRSSDSLMHIIGFLNQMTNTVQLGTGRKYRDRDLIGKAGALSDHKIPKSMLTNNGVVIFVEAKKQSDFEEKKKLRKYNDFLE
uniref:Uncharacterized protein n=1 Tax=Glossina pallidipes TaxID=7398 RepID=A0A1A9ZRI1_GLOPL